MTKKKSDPISAATAIIASPLPVGKIIARQKLLEQLYDLALAGNVSAAKLYFDLAEKDLDDTDALSTDQALKLLHEDIAASASSLPPCKGG
jgi:hypothetical protein